MCYFLDSSLQDYVARLSKNISVGWFVARVGHFQRFVILAPRLQVPMYNFQTQCPGTTSPTASLSDDSTR